MTFAELVDAKVRFVGEQIAAGRHVDGHGRGPEVINAEQADELVDVCGWDRGYDLYPEPPGAAELRATIRADAELLHAAVLRLGEMYRRER